MMSDSGISYMASSKIRSIIDRSPRAPVPRSIASSAILFKAQVVNSRSHRSILNKSVKFLIYNIFIAIKILSSLEGAVEQHNKNTSFSWLAKMHHIHDPPTPLGQWYGEYDNYSSYFTCIFYLLGQSACAHLVENRTKLDIIFYQHSSSKKPTTIFSSGGFSTNYAQALRSSKENTRAISTANIILTQ